MTAKKKQQEDDGKIDIFESGFVPKQEILNGEEKAALLESLNVSLRQLPKIKQDDITVKMLDAKRGDILKITRNSLVAGIYMYYRVVV